MAALATRGVTPVLGDLRTVKSYRGAADAHDAYIHAAADASPSREEVDLKLHEIMRNIHRQCVETAERYDTPGNYVNGANIAGFLKVAHAMLDQGLI